MIGLRIGGRERVLQLLLLVGAVELAPDFLGVVSVAELQLGRQAVVQLDGDLAVLAVRGGVGGVVTEDVIAAELLLRLHDAGSEIVAVEEHLAAGIGGEGGQGLLRIVDAGALRIVGRAVEDAGAARGGLAGGAAGRVGHQAARIDGINGDVGLDGGVDGGFELRLVVDAGLADAAGDIDQRLLFGQGGQLLDGVFDGGELAGRY